MIMISTPTFSPHVRLFVLITILLPIVVACSGGGGSSDNTQRSPLDSLPYTGLSSAAVIDSVDIEEFILLAYFGPAPLRNLTVDPQANPQANSPSLLTGTQLSFTVYGACGGTALYDLVLDDNSGEVDGSVLYTGFNDCRSTSSGTIHISGLVDLQSGDFQRMNMSFELLAFDDNTLGQLVMSGTIGVVFQGASESYTINLRVRDELSGKVFWMEGYKSTLTLRYDGTATYQAETISAGRFYDPDRGYIDVSTGTPIHHYETELWPSSGSFLAEGAQAASARLNFISSVLYSVEADTDGDGLYDYDSGRKHYPGANTLPVAVAGTDTLGNVGCSVTLDGSNSSDADLDTLQYSWAIELAPANSVSQLTAANTATPGFTPDQKGDYRFALTLFDGFDTVVDTVNLTAYGDLFCLNEATVLPYGLTGQYEAGVALGDVTSDGRADVLALTQASELHLFTQNSSGGLNTPLSHAVVNWRDVAVGDLNGDGKNDAVVTTDAGVGVLRQNSVGGLDALVETPFTPPLPYAAYSYSLALGDFNNDSRLDAAVLPEGGPLYLFLQNVDGTLGPSTTYGTSTDGWSKVMAGDVTADGLTDIVLSRADMVGSDNIGVMPQSGAGGFDPTVYYTVGTSPITYTSTLAVGDLNSDGLTDLAYELYEGIDINSTHIGVLPQATTGGTFTSPTVYSAYYPPIHDMVVADVTGDGLDDLVVLHGTPDTSVPPSPTTVAVLAATVQGTLAPYDRYPIEQTPQSWGGFAVNDVDGDGKNDIVLTAHGCDENNNNCGPNLVVLHGLK